MATLPLEGWHREALGVIDDTPDENVRATWAYFHGLAVGLEHCGDPDAARFFEALGSSFETDAMRSGLKATLALFEGTAL